MLASDALLAVHLDDNTRTLVSGPGRGAGPDFMAPRSFAYEPIRGIAWIADTAHGLIGVEMKSGDRVLRSR